MCEHANEDSLKKHGSKLVEAVFQNLRSCAELEVQFQSMVGNAFEPEVVKNVYLELTRKLCNTRVQEFIDVHRQKVSGSSTMAGQNLRDTLLTYHINPKGLM